MEKSIEAMGKLDRVEKEWDDFISHVFKGSKDSIQYKEMRKAFYAGYSRLLFYFFNEVSILPEDRGVEILEEIKNELLEFWDDLGINLRVNIKI